MKNIRMTTLVNTLATVVMVQVTNTPVELVVALVVLVGVGFTGYLDGLHDA